MEEEKELIAEIKKKRELASLADDFVEKELSEYLKRDYDAQKFLKTEINPKSYLYKKIVKEVRARLRRSFGLFRLNQDQVQQEYFLGQLKLKYNLEMIREILATNASTKERLEFYGKLYEKIFQITGKPEKILDLGCGLNPFSVVFMKLSRCTYRAYDLDQNENKLLNEFFQLWHDRQQLFQGRAEILDLLHFSSLPPSDVAFLFKVTDVLDQNQGHKKTEELLQKVPAKFVVISFSTFTMSGKRMTAPRRSWMEWLCQRLGYKQTILEFYNEIFYVVEKHF